MNSATNEMMIGLMVKTKHRQAKSLSKKHHALGLALLLTTLMIGVLYPAILSGNVPAFRDTLHFYYPLWKYVATLDFNERLLPQWNRYDAYGSNLVGEPTTMSFYPLRLLLIVDYLSLERRLGVFLAVHLAIAAGGMYLLCRRLSCRAWASVVAAISYSLSGPVFFQIYNPPYLVGAAWLPIILAELWRNFRRPSSSASVGVAVSSSLLVLGGDLQTAYHIAIIATACGLVILWQGRWHRCRSKTHARSLSIPRYRSMHNLVRVRYWLFATLLAGMFSSIQLLPTWYWFQQSNRAEVSATSKTATYEFSVPPYNWVTFIHPSVLGSYVPYHSRWVAAFDSNDRVWTPSLAFGVIGATAFAMGVMQIRQLCVRLALITFLISLLSACGDYGLGGVWNTFVLKFVAHPGDYLVANELGGLQWLWNQMLPFYDRFQYPAKWLPIASMSACVLSAQGLTQLVREKKYRRFWQLSSIFLVAWFMLGCFAMITVQAMLEPVALYDEFCGRFSSVAFQTTMVTSSVQAILLFIGIQYWYFRTKRRFAPLLILAVLDLSMNAMAMQIFADREAFQAPAHSHPSVASGRTETGSGVGLARLAAINVSFAPGDIRQWANTIASDQFARRLGKLHLLLPEDNPLAQFSLEPAPVTRFKEVIQRTPSPDWKECKDAELSWEQSNQCRVKRHPWSSEPITIPILMSEGWSATAYDANGIPRNVKITSTDGLRITLSNIEGIDDVRLRFTPPGLRLGVALFGLGLAMAFFRPLIRFAIVCYSLLLDRVVRE